MTTNKQQSAALRPWIFSPIAIGAILLAISIRMLPALQASKLWTQQPPVSWIRSLGTEGQGFRDGLIAILDEESIVVCSDGRLPGIQMPTGVFLVKVHTNGTILAYMNRPELSGPFDIVTTLDVSGGRILLGGTEYRASDSDGKIAKLSLYDSDLNPVWLKRHSYITPFGTEYGRTASSTLLSPDTAVWSHVHYDEFYSHRAVVIDTADRQIELDSNNYPSRSIRSDNQGRIYSIDCKDGTFEAGDDLTPLSEFVVRGSRESDYEVEKRTIIRHPRASGGWQSEFSLARTPRLDVSDQGDVYLAVPLLDSGAFGEHALNAGVGRGVAVIKWRLDSGIAWIRYIRTPNVAHVRQLQADPTGGVIVGGIFAYDLIDDRGFPITMDMEGIVVTGRGGMDSFLWKLSDDGGSEWAIPIGSTDPANSANDGLSFLWDDIFDDASDRLFAVDDDGSIYIVGFSVVGSRAPEFFIGDSSFPELKSPEKFVAKLVPPQCTNEICIKSIEGDSELTAGMPASLLVVAKGEEVQYEWFHNGTALAGSNSPELRFTPTKRSDGGAFVVRVSNRQGKVDSSPVQVNVRVPQALRVSQSPTGVKLHFRDSSGEAMTLGLMSRLEVQMSTNLVSWTKAAVELVLSAGDLECEIQAIQGSYFRIIEK